MKQQPEGEDAVGGAFGALRDMAVISVPVGADHTLGPQVKAKSDDEAS